MFGTPVLVVEDNPIEQKLTSMLLNKFGYAAIVVGEGHAAIELLQAGAQFALILMDWQLTDMDGLQCTRELRRILDGKFVPIVAVTARAMLGDKQKCLNAGMDDYISKPYTAKQFENIVRHWTEASKASLTG